MISHQNHHVQAAEHGDRLPGPSATGNPAISTPVPPAVSVVLPVRDGGRLLDTAVASILDQTLENLELILVDVVPPGASRAPTPGLN